MMSPGSRVSWFEMRAMSSLMGTRISLVLADVKVFGATPVRSASAFGSGTSSVVMSSGPSGQKVSCDFPNRAGSSVPGVDAQVSGMEGR